MKNKQEKKNTPYRHAQLLGFFSLFQAVSLTQITHYTLSFLQVFENRLSVTCSGCLMPCLPHY